MDRERIERLAIDSAAGELNEDAEALFRSYLAEHPDANEWAMDMMGAYEMTETAIEAKTKDAGAPPIADTKVSRPVDWRSAGRWAAVLAIGLFAGFSAGRWSRPLKTKQIAVVRIAEQPRVVATAADLKAKYAGTFWGQKVLASLKPRPSIKREDRRETGDIWDMYRRRVKEKCYE